MTIRIAINGYGRIGRNILRAFFENPKQHDVEIIAINDLGNIEINAHLTRYDTTHGKFKGTIDIDKDYLIVNNQRIKIFSERNAENLPWKELDIDVVHECTGLFTSPEKAGKHIKAGGKKSYYSRSRW